MFSTTERMTITIQGQEVFKAIRYVVHIVHLCFTILHVLLVEGNTKYLQLAREVQRGLTILLLWWVVPTSHCLLSRDPIAAIVKSLHYSLVPRLSCN